MLQRANILDEAALLYKKHEADTARRRIWRDGTLKRDGSEDRSGMGRESIHEREGSKYTLTALTETVISDESSHVLVANDSTEAYVNSIARDGSRLRNGMLQRANMLDEAALSYKKHEADTARRRIWRDGKLKRDGSEDRSGMGRESIHEREESKYTVTPLTETVTAGESSRVFVANDSTEAYVNSVKRDGAYKRDGLLQRASLLDTAGMSYKTAAVKEVAQHRIFRNGMVRRDGTASRSGFGSSGMYENGVAAVKLPVNKEIEEAQDAAFQMAYKNNSDDLFRNTRKRDGALPRDGVARRSNYIIDVYIFKYAAAAFREEAAMSEAFTAGLRKHHYRDGGFLRDGSMLRDSMMLLPL
jgi:hypothetical protein